MLVSEVAHTGEDGKGLIEIANFGDTEVDVADLRVDVVNQFGRRFAGYVWAGRMPVEKLGPGEAVVVQRDERGRGFTEGPRAWCCTTPPVLYASLVAEDGVSYQCTSNPDDKGSDFVAV